MSDGITEAYRASHAADRFRKKWQKAQVEEILLTDLRKELVPLATEQLMYKAYQESEWLKINHDIGWLVKYEWGECFQQSINSDLADKYPQVKRYRVEVGSAFGTFQDYSLNEALIDAILYVRWLKTPEGKKAYQDYQDD